MAVTTQRNYHCRIINRTSTLTLHFCQSFVWTRTDAPHTLVYPGSSCLSKYTRLVTLNKADRIVCFKTPLLARPTPPIRYQADNSSSRCSISYLHSYKGQKTLQITTRDIAPASSQCAAVSCRGVRSTHNQLLPHDQSFCSWITAARAGVMDVLSNSLARLCWINLHIGSLVVP